MNRIIMFLGYMILIAFMMSGCGTFQKNKRMEHWNRSEGYRFNTLNKGSKNSDSLFVVLSFSGGGTRAASFSYGVLEALYKTEIEWKGERKSLLDEVDIISSVSGGSFTAAYYGLNRERLFDGSFDKIFLKKNIEKALAEELLYPSSWFKLAGSSFGRSDMASEYYDNHIFLNARYEDLIETGERPFVILNATDMTTGMPFPFTQDQFDLICSDISELPIAKAVTCSSAFPGLLTPLTFKNFAPGCGYEEASWLEDAEKNRRSNPEMAERAEKMRTYYDPRPWEARRNFIHLMDGGVADNIGMRGVIFALESIYSPYSIMQRINIHDIEKLLIIIVNAATEPVSKRDEKAKVPGLIDVMTSSATIPLSAYSFDTVKRTRSTIKDYNTANEIREICEEILKEKCGETLSGKLYKIDTYVSHITFDFITDPEKRFRFKNLPTNFNLSPGTVDELKSEAKTLLKSDPQYEILMKDLGVKN